MAYEEMIREHKDHYLVDPTIQPTAFWKFKAWALDPNVKIFNSNGVRSWVLDTTMFNRVPLGSGYLRHIDESCKVLVLDTEVDLLDGWSCTRYFKLFHDLEGLEYFQVPEGFSFRRVVCDEIPEVVELINRSYEKIRVSQDQVHGWKKSKVYDERLWIWIVDEKTNQKAALGIANIDQSIGEGELDWIQVDGAYRGMGLGKALVLKLLSDIKGIGSFVTVAGEVDNLTSPEKLYRSCGFKGDRTWFVYSR